MHGFTGHPERTWKQKKPTAKESHASNLNGDSHNQFARWFSKAESIFWPYDLLKQSFSTARVLTYGYDTHVKHRVGPVINNSTVYDVASDLLSSLHTIRESEPLRPLILIAHSLGGIIVKEALRQSHRSPQRHLRSVCEATRGILFFGTPHNGSDPRNTFSTLAEYLLRMTGVRVNQHIVDALLPSSERLRELREEFPPIALANKWIIYSFQEEYGIWWLSGKKVCLII